MVVKFSLAKHLKATVKRKNKKIAVGQLLGSKTDVREAEDDDGREDDNVSALELALNHSDTVAADKGKNEGTKKLHNFRLIPPLISRRKGSQTTPPTSTASVRKLHSIGEEKRDDCADKSLVDLQSQGTNATSSLNNVDKQSISDSVRIEAPLEVTVTAESLSGLMSKRNAHPGKSSNSNSVKGSNGVKVKGYIRVVGKAPGVKIVSGTTKIVKSYRLGTSTAPSSNPNHSTLIFSNESSGMKPTGSLRIRLPPPTYTATNSVAKYEVLTFEVGVLTPDGIFPLGTSTYQPLHKSSKLQQSDVLKVDPIHKGSIFQRRKPLVVSPKLSTTSATLDKDSNYRLLRKSRLSLKFDIKPLSDKEYMAHKHKSEPLKPINNSLDGVPKSQSCPGLDSSNGIVNDEIPENGTTPNELQNAKSDPSGGLIMYLSDPLSCCSDRDVDSGDEEAIPDDVKTQVTEPLVEDAHAETALSMEDIEPENVAQEHELQPETIASNDINKEECGWCYFFPICCFVGTSTSDRNVDHIQNDDDMATLSAQDNKISKSDILVHDAGITPRYLEQSMISNESEHVNDETYHQSGHRYGDVVHDILRSDSDMQEPQDRSVVGTRNCCMQCFGDEDVENLKFAKFKSIEEDHELLDRTDKSTDAIYDIPIENGSQSDSDEASSSKLGDMTGQEQPTKTTDEKIDMMEIDECSTDRDAVDGNLSPRVDAVLGTMSSSYVDDDEDETIDSVEFSDLEGNVGCFQWMGAVSSEGLDADNSMSFVSSESQSDSLEGIVVNTADTARIPISKSEDVATVVPTSSMKTKLLLQSNSIS